VKLSDICKGSKILQFNYVTKDTYVIFEEAITSFPPPEGEKLMLKFKQGIKGLF